VRTPPPDVTEVVPDLPPGLVAFIQGALAKKPSERLSDWERILGLLGGAEAGAAGWGNAEEWLLRVRCLPAASSRVRAALEALEAELAAEEGVDLARVKLDANKGR